MRDNPGAVAAPVEQPGMASKGDGTLGKGMGRDKISLPSSLEKENPGQGVIMKPSRPRGIHGDVPPNCRGGESCRWVDIRPAPPSSWGRVLWAE